MHAYLSNKDLLTRVGNAPCDMEIKYIHAVGCMQLPNAVHGKLVRRYKRFLADIEGLQPARPSGIVETNAASSGKGAEQQPAGEQHAGTSMPQVPFTTVHCPNTGPMTGLLDWCVLVLFDALYVHHMPPLQSPCVVT